MDAILIYFIKVNIAVAALYLFYKILLNRDTFFREKRFAFIIGMLFALLHPFIDLSSWIEGSRPAEIAAQSISTTLPEIVIDGSSQPKHLSTEEMFFIVYGIIAAVFLFRLFWQIAKLVSIVFRRRKNTINGLKVVEMPEGTSPFSFFGWVFLDKDEFSARDLEEILRHESVHMSQYHSIDVIFAELFCALFWINPFSWLLKNSLRENLEYLADRQVIHSGFDAAGYQYNLLRLSYQKPVNNIANHFNLTQLKNRIIMMNKKNTSLAGLCKYVLSLPLFAFLLLSAYAWGAKAQLIPIDEMATMAMQSVDGKSKIVYSMPANGKSTDNEKIYRNVETMPAFPGGKDALMNYLNKNIRYPAAAQMNKLQGKVVVLFVVDKTGRVKDPKVLRTAGPELDKEALRVISGMPLWTPGKNNGENVSSFFTLPIIFKLQDSKNSVIRYTAPACPYKTLNAVDEMPAFPGGKEALIKFISKNLRYPKTAKDAGIEGRVVVRFVISETGKPENIEVVKSLDPACDNEAIRVLGLMPDWTPGKKDGKNVPVHYTMPILFRLSNSALEKTIKPLANDNGKDPLILVDGEIYAGSLSDIKPDEIQDITVLKGDAAIKGGYGEKAVNGVISIRMKEKRSIL